MKVELLSVTPDAEALIENAARTCYASHRKTGPESAGRLIHHLIKSGHESPLEHAYATFRISGVSRAMTHQLVRHRLCAFSQKSQRYVSEKDFEYVIPPSIAKEYQEDYERDMEAIRGTYVKWLLRGIEKEDVRFVLPNACTSEIVVSANFRECRHVFSVRCTRHAQWEIRSACTIMLRELHQHAPHVFDDIIDSIPGHIPDASEDIDKTAGIKRCSECHKAVSYESLYCHICGAEVPAQGYPLECPSCHRQVSGLEKFCKVCGASIPRLYG